MLVKGLLLVLVTCFYVSQARERLVKTFRFGAKRQLFHQWDIWWKVLEWKQVFVRLDAPPMEIPNEFTWCTWYWQDFKHREFTFFSWTGTVDGRSITEYDDPITDDWYNLTYGYYEDPAWLRVHHNLLIMDLWYETLESYWGSKWDNMGKIEPALYQKWRFFCLGVNLKEATMVVYNDGELVDQKILEQGDSGFYHSFEENKNLTTGLITDIFLGGLPKFSSGYWNSFGRMSQVHMFSRILSHNEMVGMTTCGGKKLRGDLIDWETAKWDSGADTYGNVQEIWQSMETICPQEEYGGIFLPTRPKLPFDEAISVCKMLKRKVISIADEEEFQKALVLMADLSEQYKAVGVWYTSYDGDYHADYQNKGIPVTTACTDEDKDLTFHDYYTGKPCSNITRWNVDQPFYVPLDPNFEPTNSYYRYYPGGPFINDDPGYPSDIWANETILMERNTFFTLCVGNYHGASDLKIRIKGICEATEYDIEYVWDWLGYDGNEQMMRYIGPMNSSISYHEGDGTWKIDKVYEKMHKQEITIYTPRISMGLGRHRVFVEDDPCTNGKEDKYLTITVTHCGEDEFTCSDGACVNMDRRCNRITDCPDLSDEENCQITQLDSSYIGDYEPVTVDKNYEIEKVSVNVTVQVLDILQLSEIEGLFTVSFKLFMTWYDPRIVYTNLKLDRDLNKLTTVEKETIWKPVVVFDNTKSKLITQTDERTLAMINRKGEFSQSPSTEPEETYFFEGSENPITYTRIYDIPFICNYNMAWYPFDIQLCTMDLKPDGNTGKYVDLWRESFEYKGSEDLSVYFIKDSRFEEVKFDKINTVKVEIWLGRRLLSVITTVYTPTVLLNVIGHITHYFKPFFFESALAVNLTVMLVLTSMLISVVESLPQTAYIKMVEIWLIFNLLLPFTDVILHTTIDCLRSDLEEEREVNHHGHAFKVDGDGNFLAPGERVEETPVEVIGPDYDKKLVSRVEQTQDNALKKLYAEYEKGVVRKKKMLAFCHMLGHRIMPAIAIWFVISYWLAGMSQYYGVPFSTNVTVELVFSGVYYLSLIVLQLAFKDIAKAFQ